MSPRRWQFRLRGLVLIVALAAIVAGIGRWWMSPSQPTVPISPAIERAVRVAFTPEHHAAVREGIAHISWDDGEWVRAATLALTFGDRALFDHWILTAQADAHDVAYVLESPELVRPDLTRAELVRRYRLMGLPVPERLTPDP